MIDTAERLIAALEGQTVVDWYRFAERSTYNGRLSPPLVVWRYKRSQPDLERALANIVATYKGRVPWVYERSERNWVLMPKKIAEIQRERTLPTDSAAMRTLSEEEPEFCRIARLDLDELVDRIEAEVDQE